MTEIRKFNGGALRDTSSGKLEYLGFTHPYLEYSFAKYMDKHRVMEDGSLRDSNNWWSGFGKDTVMQSLTRHIEDLKLIYSGFSVYECRRDGKVTKEVYQEPLKELPKDYTQITIEDCCNAIKFNTNAFLLEDMVEKGEVKKCLDISKKIKG